MNYGNLKRNAFFVAVLCGALCLCTSVQATSPAISGFASPSDPGFQKAAFPGRASGAATTDHGKTTASSVLNTTSGTFYDSIDAAVAAASSGDIIEVIDAFLSEGLVHIDKSITLRGASGVVKTVSSSISTGDTGDARAWFLVDVGVDLDVSDLVFDGSGRSIYQAFRHKGLGTFTNCHFRNIGHGSYQGFGIVAFGGNVDITGSTFINIGRVGVLFYGTGITGSIADGNTFQGKGSGDHLDYGIELGDGASVEVLGSSFKNCLGISNDGSFSAGLLATTYFGPGTNVTVTSNTFENNEHGVHLGTGSATADTSSLDAHFNLFLNSSPGVKHYSDATINVENNWWGCNGGPADTVNCGEAIAGDGYFFFAPWLVLTMNAGPVEIPVGDIAVVEVDLNHNSDGDDISTIGMVSDGTYVVFASDDIAGTVDPASAALSNGSALATYTGLSTGIGWVSSTLNTETVVVQIGVGISLEIFSDGFESGDTLLWDDTQPLPPKAPIRNPADIENPLDVTYQ